jgi:thiol:disulfide interchange protein DsbD
MVAVKSIFAVFLLAIGLGYLRLAIPWLGHLQTQIAPYWIVSALVALAGLALGAIHLSFGKTSAQSIRKGFGVALISLGTFFALGGASQPSPVHWQLDADRAIATAKSAQKPVFIDFGAQWCTACKELEHDFSSREFVAEIDRFVPVRVDGSFYDDQFKRYCDRYEVDGLPVMVVLNSRGEVAHIFRSRVPLGEILSVLRAVR